MSLADQIIDGGLSSFGARLRQARQNAGLTQQELAARTGIIKTGITKIENGRQEVALSQLLALASALDTTPSSLLDEVALPTVEVIAHYEVRCFDHGLVVSLDSAAEAAEYRQRHVRAHLRNAATAAVR